MLLAFPYIEPVIKQVLITSCGILGKGGEGGIEEAYFKGIGGYECLKDLVVLQEKELGDQGMDLIVGRHGWKGGTILEEFCKVFPQVLFF